MKNEVIENSSIQANASVEPNEGGKERKTKFVVSFVECESNENVEKKNVHIVGIYDSFIMADNAMKESMFDTMIAYGYGCYIYVGVGENGTDEDGPICLSWEELGVEYCYAIKKVAA